MAGEIEQADAVIGLELGAATVTSKPASSSALAMASASFFGFLSAPKE